VQSVHLYWLWCITQSNTKVHCATRTAAPFKPGCTKKLLILDQLLSPRKFFLCFVVSKFSSRSTNPLVLLWYGTSGSGVNTRLGRSALFWDIRQCRVVIVW
jgi:hypothetical protein